MKKNPQYFHKKLNDLYIENIKLDAFEFLSFVFFKMRKYDDKLFIFVFMHKHTWLRSSSCYLAFKKVRKMHRSDN